MSASRNSLLCPNCRKLISADEPACPYCGLLRPGLHHKAGLINKLLLYFEPVKTIIYVNVAFFIISLLLNPGAVLIGGGSLFRFLSPSDQSLALLGATGTYPVFGLHHYWSLISASFLHGGILHIFFNMMALSQLGYFILREFGVYRFFVIYILTGVTGFAVSLFAGVTLTIGASASICGLIGAIIYFGKSRGGHYGEAIYKQALGWVAGLVIFGFMFSGINNWAHGGGLLSGIGLAYLLGYNERKSETAGHRLLSLVCIIVTAGVLLWAVFSSLVARFIQQ